MINKAKLRELICAALSESSQSIIDAEVDRHAIDMLPQLEKLTTYPDWHSRHDTLADIDFMILRINSNKVFEQNLRDALINYLKLDSQDSRPSWFVGAHWDDEDQTSRFLDQGIWENGYDEKYSHLVKSIKVGDKIAIKSTYTRKKNLPFESRGHSVSVMAIKAIGVVTENKKDGKLISVEWKQSTQQQREWYFYTGRQTIWKVEPGEWIANGLLNFTFYEQEQDYKRFMNHNFWKERFGNTPEEDIRFKWTKFYESIADALLVYIDRRAELSSFIVDLAAKHKLSYLYDKGIEDIDPFTVIGLFNRGITNDNRQILAHAIAEFLGVDTQVPESFEAIPILNNQKSCFFWGMGKRSDNAIDELWALFKVALNFADEADDISPDKFEKFYNIVASHKGIRWNITMGLYWIRPWFYPTLESQSQEYLSALSIKPELNGPKKSCNGNDYLLLRDNLLLRFAEDAFPVHSFPELSLHAWQRPSSNKIDKAISWKNAVFDRVKDLCLSKGSASFTRVEFKDNYLDELQTLFPDNNSIEFTVDRHMQILRDEGEIEFVKSGCYEWLGFENIDTDIESNNILDIVAAEPYDVESIINDGCFISHSILNDILSRLKSKKNIILQGPPGTGKTWLGKRLAYALIGEKQPAYLKAVQFHPNLSYEDFIKGWRPSGDGKLALCDGPFLEFVKLAQQKPAQKYVVVIEEINRGNPAQIFGEMLTLLEADKRTPSEALELSYRKEDDKPVYIPDNLYVIGTMNVADRSLALVDLALRRRFAFINLVPTFGLPWRTWVHEKAGIDLAYLLKIETKLELLNQVIASDDRLGVQFQVGHSYVTPAFDSDIKDAANWFRLVVETEIFPLLEEYWFDDPTKALSQKSALLKDL
jgi:5-methylcytosine-specific restriction protein B